MAPIQISQDILPVAKFKARVSEVLPWARAQGRPVAITQGGEPAGVLLSPREYDQLTYQQRFLDSVNRRLVSPGFPALDAWSRSWNATMSEKS